MKKLILIPLVVIGLIVVILFANSFIAKEKLYYVPQMGMYIKTICYPKDEFGYILFGKDRTLTLCDTVDYIAVSKRTGVASATLLVNPNKKNEINISLLDNYIYKKKEVHYKFYIFNHNPDGDTKFYEKRHLSDPLKLRKPFINIQVNDYFESIFISNYDDVYLHKLEPIN